MILLEEDRSMAFCKSIFLLDPYFFLENLADTEKKNIVKKGLEFIGASKKTII